MTEAEFVERYEREKKMFEAWGTYIRDIIAKGISDSGKDIELFLKIPTHKDVPRVKKTDSIIVKAFHRGKNYTNPYEEITDKVGIRFIVLLSSDIKAITDIIDSHDKVKWVASRDKDFLLQRDETPELFTYESVHYVLYSLESMNYDGIEIAPNTPCEVQVRTLLQHAYAEMSHDTTYKPSVKASPNVKRQLARSMALVESADVFFCSAIDEINIKSQELNRWSELCRKYYPHIANDELIDNQLEIFIADKISLFTEGVVIKDIENFLDKLKQRFDDLIKRKHSSSWIYRQPTVLLVYYLLYSKPTEIQRKWPFQESLLLPLLSDMGISPIEH